MSLIEERVSAGQVSVGLKLTCKVGSVRGRAPLVILSDDKSDRHFDATEWPLLGLLGAILPIGDVATKYLDFKVLGQVIYNLGGESSREVSGNPL